MRKLSTTPFARLMAWSLPFLILLQISYGQTSLEQVTPTPVKAPFIRASILNGKFIGQKGPFFTGADDFGNYFKTTKALSLEYGWQMLGGNEWTQTCNYPRMGVGLQYLHVMNRNELGHPFSLYGFYDGNFFRSKNFELTSRMSAGFAYGLTTYDPDDVLPNDIICTKVNAFVELGVGSAIRLNESIYIEPGLRLTHFSNGNIREPQKGINVISYSLGLRSYLNGPPPEPIKMTLSEYEHRHEIITFIGVASRQMEFHVKDTDWPTETYGMNYLMTNLHLGYNFELTRRFKLGTGFDFIYDGTNGQQELAKSSIPDKQAIPTHDKLGLAVFVSGETAIDQLSIVTTLGYMVAGTRFESSSPRFEQRLGFKYHFYQHYFAGVNVRSYNFRAAKALEFNVGMRKYLK